MIACADGTFFVLHCLDPFGQNNFPTTARAPSRKQEGPINIGVMLVDLQRFNALRPSLLKHGLGTRPGDTRTRMSYSVARIGKA